MSDRTLQRGSESSVSEAMHEEPNGPSSFDTPRSSRGSSFSQCCGNDSRPIQVQEPAVVAIGISTGGPSALERILPRFPRSLPVPILIVQHMPSGFITPLAERLNALCSISVCEATQHQLIEPGIAYLAPAGAHMRVVESITDQRPRIVLDSRRGRAVHIPSIDELMKSVAVVYRNRAIGVIMTGMGCDGASGMAAIYHQGGLTIGQDESSCTVYGMPRICAERRVLRRVVALVHIPNAILGAIRDRKLT